MPLLLSYFRFIRKWLSAPALMYSPPSVLTLAAMSEKVCFSRWYFGLIIQLPSCCVKVSCLACCSVNFNSMSVM